MKLFRKQGFTLIELMIVIAIVGVSLALMLPNFQAAIRNNAREEAAMSLANALALARSEAVARGMPIVLRPNIASDPVVGDGLYSGGAWSIETQNGSPAFPGDLSPLIESYQVSEVDSVTDLAGVVVTAPFVFQSNGTLSQTAVLKFCFSDVGTCNQLRVNLVGRSQVARVDK